jgi:hypothetical protein
MTETRPVAAAVRSLLSTSQPNGVSATRWEGASLKAPPHIAAPFLPRVLLHAFAPLL